MEVFTINIVCVLINLGIFFLTGDPMAIFFAGLSGGAAYLAWRESL